MLMMESIIVLTKFLQMEFLLMIQDFSKKKFHKKVNKKKDMKHKFTLLIIVI